MTAPSGFLRTVNIRRTWVAHEPSNGATALVLDIIGAEPTAFVVNLEIIKILRGDLEKAELLLRPGAGVA